MILWKMWEEWECCSFSLFFVYYVCSEWIVPQLHSIGSIVKKRCFLFLLCPYYLCHFLKANSQILFISSCLYPYCPWLIMPQNFVFFPSISISENSLCNSFHSVNSEIFPFVEQGGPIFIFISWMYCEISVIQILCSLIAVHWLALLSV